MPLSVFVVIVAPSLNWILEPPLAKAPIYQRMWQVLSGADTAPRYRDLKFADRRAIVEILNYRKDGGWRCGPCIARC